MHRFTITYQKKQRKKDFFKLELTQIEGIGEKTAIKILNKLEDKQNLKNYSAEYISKIAKIDIKKSKKILEYLNKYYYYK